MTDPAWYLKAHGPARHQEPNPPAELVQPVLAPALAAVMEGADLADVTEMFAAGFRSLDALVDDEALSLSGASLLSVILASAEAAMAHGCSAEASNQLAYSYSALALGTEGREEMSAIIRKHRPGTQASAPPPLWKIVLRALARLAGGCSPECIRAVMTFPYRRFQEARQALWEESSSYDEWCRRLRRLLVARRHFTTVCLDEMVAPVVASEGDERGPRIEFHIDEDRLQVRGSFSVPPQTKKMREQAQTLRDALITPFFTESEVLALRQQAILAEEAFVYALVICRGSRTEHGPVVAPSEDEVRAHVEALSALGDEDPLTARARAREEFRLRLTLPRYAFDEVERHLLDKV